MSWYKEQTEKRRRDEIEARLERQIKQLSEENKRLQALVDRWVPKDAGYGGGA